MGFPINLEVSSKYDMSWERIGFRKKVVCTFGLIYIGFVCSFLVSQFYHLRSVGKALRWHYLEKVMRYILY